MDYIDWAVQQGFGVIDVNIPEYITPADHDPANPHGHAYGSTETDLARLEGEKLVNYLFTNYIEPNDNERIILMGVGNAFHAVAKLLSESETVYQNITAVIGFIAVNPVRPVGSNSNAWITSWYRNNSLIYVAKTHALWKKAKDGKISKRYGDIHETYGDGGDEIMRFNEKAVKSWILEKVHDEDDTEDDDDVGQVIAADQLSTKLSAVVASNLQTGPAMGELASVEGDALMTNGGDHAGQDADNTPRPS